MFLLYTAGKSAAGVTSVTYRSGDGSFSAPADGYYVYVGLHYNTKGGAGLDFSGASTLFNQSTLLNYGDKDVGCRVVICKLSKGQSVHFTGGAPYNWFVAGQINLG